MAQRERALHACQLAGIGPRPEHPHVAGVLVDIPSGDGFVVVAALADGSTAMYMSAGTDITGAGVYEPVAAANLRLLSAIQTSLGRFPNGADESLPPPKMVRFHLLGETAMSGTLDVSEAGFWGRETQTMMGVMLATQQLIAAIREAGASS